MNTAKVAEAINFCKVHNLITQHGKDNLSLTPQTKEAFSKGAISIVEQTPIKKLKRMTNDEVVAEVVAATLAYLTYSKQLPRLTDEQIVVCSCVVESFITPENKSELVALLRGK